MGTGPVSNSWFACPATRRLRAGLFSRTILQAHLPAYVLNLHLLLLYLYGRVFVGNIYIYNITACRNRITHVIAEARKLSPEKGSIKLLGTPASFNFNVHWGAEAR